MSRWYEKYDILSRGIESMRHMSNAKREGLVLEIMKIIKKCNPSLLDDYVAKFPMEVYGRRWYDQDPYLWLVLNGLKYASDELICEVESFLAGELYRLPVRREVPQRHRGHQLS